MKIIYKKILEKALPYYEKGRKGDVEHVKWLFNTIPKFVDETMDIETLIPVVLLHDVGYSKVQKGSNPFDLNIRKLHSEEGAKIAVKILEELKYPKEKISEIKRLILKHDNWAFGDSFTDEPLLLFFQNFDFMWMASKEGFEMCGGSKDAKEFYKRIEKFQEKNIERGIKWYNKKVKDFYNKLMRERKKQLK